MSGRKVIAWESANVAVLREMNADYQQCVSTCKQLSQRSSQCDLTAQSSLSAASLTTDRLLYSCAIEMVCSALLLVDIPFGFFQQHLSRFSVVYLSFTRQFLIHAFFTRLFSFLLEICPCHALYCMFVRNGLKSLNFVWDCDHSLWLTLNRHVCAW